MDFDFPTEIILEGQVKVIVPKLSNYVTKPSDYAPSKAPVFYNPIMALNRDIAVLVLQTYQNILGRELLVCEPMTGCGIRGVRFAIEVDGINNIMLNDIDPKSTNLAIFNAKMNGVSDKILVSNEDANLFLSRNAAPKKRFDYIDIDPFGTPVNYIDSALRASRNNGLIALTATDMAPLCGVHPRACIRKYWGRSLRTEYCHELAVRLLVGSLTMMAAKHDIGLEVLFSNSIDHYIRVYATINYGAKISDHSVKKMGYILHCFSCFNREIVLGLSSFHNEFCPMCGAKFEVAGPLWLGQIADKNFCSLLIKEVESRKLLNEKKILKLLDKIKNEAQEEITYYAVDKICDKLNCPVPPQMDVINRLRKDGFKAVLTHFNSRGIRTNAPANKITEIIISLITQ